MTSLAARLRAFRHSESGSSIVEFAIVVPVLALLLMGIIEISRFAYFALLASNAARAGASYGSLNLASANDTTGIKNAAATDAQNLTGLTVTTTPQCYNDGTASTCSYYVQVNTTGIYKSLFKYPGLPQTVTVSGQSIMRVAAQ